MKGHPLYNLIVNLTFVIFLITLGTLLTRDNRPAGNQFDIRAIDFDKTPLEQASPWKRTAKRRFINRSRKYDPLIIKIARAHGADPNLIRAIVMTESGYRPNVISKRGALGLMQLMPQTARSLGIRNALNPKENITGGIKYFQWLLEEFKQDKVLALAAYNAGIGKVRQYKNKVPPYPETRQFIRKVYNYYLLL